MSSIPVIYSFARSGGTLVNQLLGVHPQCAVLSEVNPAASYKPIAEQALEWLELIAPDEADGLSRLPYRRQIGFLRERAAERAKQLVVRDWVTVNFLPGSASERIVASGQVEQDLYLTSAGLEPVPLVVTRRGGAVYRSITRTFPHLQGLGLDEFARRYLQYARAVAKWPRVQMEALRAKPEAALVEILKRFKLDASDPDSILRNFHEFRNCTGNTTLQGANGSASARQVLPPEPALSPVDPAHSHPQLREADQILGYER